MPTMSVGMTLSTSAEVPLQALECDSQEQAGHKQLFIVTAPYTCTWDSHNRGSTRLPPGLSVYDATGITHLLLVV
jgi:hypothetical protein